MYQLILASESPRRKQLLNEAGFQFEIHPSYVSEFLEKNLTVKEQILSLARRKSSSVLSQLQAQKSQPFVVLGSDTMVVIDERPISKPENETEAFEFLKSLSGRVHEVITAVCMIESRHQQELSQVETTRVKFRNITDQEIWDYIKTGEPLDKAGAYAIQGGGKKFVELIDGELDNVIGLPIKVVKKLWSQFQSPIFLNYQLVARQVFELSKGKCQVLPVSKLQSVEKVKELTDHNVKHFAENYIQEATEKILNFSSVENLNWHLIGHIQKNKVKFIKDNFFMIHSVDSFELAELIHKKISTDSLKRQKVLLQINLAQERSKEGFTESEFLKLWPALENLTNLEICGLMTMPPLVDNPEDNRPYFRQLSQLLKSLKKTSSLHPLDQLSMGTTSDYRVAIEEGSTWVRLGTIIFGERPLKNKALQN